MCDLSPDKYISLYHQISLSDEDAIPLDAWLNANTPDNYRIISIMKDKIITDGVAYSYHIVMELIS